MVWGRTATQSQLLFLQSVVQTPLAWGHAQGPSPRSQQLPQVPAVHLVTRQKTEHVVEFPLLYVLWKAGNEHCPHFICGSVRAWAKQQPA